MDIEINKNFLKKVRTWVLSLLTPALISTFIAAFFIWAHLARIGQTGLFFDSVSFSSLFSYLMVFACISVLLFCVVFFTPSFLAGIFIYNDKGDEKNRETLMENNIKVILFTSLLSVLILFGYFFYAHRAGQDGSQHVYIQLSIIYLASILFSLYFNGRITRDKVNAMKWRKKASTVILMHLLKPALFALTACIYIFPLELFLRTLEFPEGTSELRQMLTVIALSIFLIIFSLMPGVAFLRLRDRSSLLRQITVTGGIMAGVLLVIFVFVHMVPALILTLFLRTSGIMDLSPHVYGVPTASYPAAYFRDPAWQETRSTDENYYLLQAVKLYSLGDIRLICPTNIIKSYKDSLKYQIFDTDFDDNVRGKLQDSVTQCRRVKGQELLTLEKLPEPKKIN